MKNKTQSIVSILGLMAGIVCFTICSYYGREMYRGDSCFPTYDRMAGLFTYIPDNLGDGNYKYYQPTDEVVDQFLQIGFEEVEAVARYSRHIPSNVNVEFSDTLTICYRATVKQASDGFFQVFPSEVLEGNVSEFATRPDAAVITRSFARRLGSKESLVGKKITFLSNQYDKTTHESGDYTIVGVVEDYPDMTSPTRSGNLEVILHKDVISHASLLLKPGTDIRAFNQRLQHYTFGQDEQENEPIQVQLFSSVRTHTIALMLLSLIGFLILLTGVINFLSFTIGAFLNRIRELSLRTVLGASFRHLFSLLAVEVLLVLLTSSLCSMAFIEGVLPYLVTFIPTDGLAAWVDTSALIRQQGEYFLILFAVCLFIAYISIRRTRRMSALMGLKGGNATGRRHRFRNTMLGVQFFICVLFLLATIGGVMEARYYFQLANPQLTTQEQERILLLSTQREIALQDHTDEIAQYIQNSGWAESMAFREMSYARYQAGDDTREVNLYGVTPEFFRIMNYPVEWAENEDYFCFVNPSLKALLEKDSLSNGFTVNDVNYPVSGSIDYKEVHYIPEVAFVPYTPGGQPDIYIKVREGVDVAKARKELITKVQEYLPEGASARVQGLQEAYGVEAVKLILFLWLIATVICILITILGMYGAITLDTQRRQKEVAIRKINGAGMKQISWLFGRLYCWLFLVAVLICFPLALALLTFASQNTDQLFDYRQPWYWLVTLFTAAAIIAVTIGYRLYKVSRTNPAEVIKNDN